MKVLKFGGTSVGTPESLLNVKKIVESIPGNAIIVVSALGGLTDRLIATAEMASNGDKAWEREMEAMEQRHHNIINKVVADHLKADVKKEVDSLLGDLRRKYTGLEMLGLLPQQALDLIVSFGERMSSVIVTAMIKDARRFDSLEFVKTEKWFGKNIADTELTTRLIVDKFDAPFDKAVVPGFISRDKDSGEITNLGRGGSDYTAALIAAALGAELLEIWTDVDGFMTADPRIIPEARIVDHMTFIESMELCTYGAKVIYPPTIYPVFHKNIPIKILNTFHPEAPGTLITDTTLETDIPVKGVSALKKTSLVWIARNAESKIADMSGRTLNALSRQGIKVVPVSLNDTENLFSFSVSEADLLQTLRILDDEFAPEIASGDVSSPEYVSSLSTIAVVGENMKSNTRLVDRIRHTLKREGVEMEAYSFGNSATTLLFLVNNTYTDDSLRLTHSLLF